MKQTLGDHLDKSKGVLLTAGMAEYFSGFRNAALLAIVYKALWYLTTETAKNLPEHKHLHIDFDGVPWRRTTHRGISEFCYGWVSERSLERLIPTLIDNGYIYRKETVELGVKQYWYAVNLDVTN